MIQIRRNSKNELFVENKLAEDKKDDTSKSSWIKNYYFYRLRLCVKKKKRERERKHDLYGQKEV